MLKFASQLIFLLQLIFCYYLIVFQFDLVCFHTLFISLKLGFSICNNGIEQKNRVELKPYDT